MTYFEDNFDAFLLSGRLSLEYGRTAHLYAKRKLEQALADGDVEAHQFWTVVYAAIRPRGEQSDTANSVPAPVNDISALVEWQGRLRNVLNTIWDPIGGCPDDEYDWYVREIASLVGSGASDDTLREFLRWSEAERMGLYEPALERLDLTMSAVRALGPTP